MRSLGADRTIVDNAKLVFSKKTSKPSGRERSYRFLDAGLCRGVGIDDENDQVS
jgi:hypothetical protein